MKLIKEYGLFIYWGILLLDCVLSIFNIYDNRVYTNPILLPVLAAYFFVNTKRSKHRRSKTLIYLSLLIAYIADLLFLQNDMHPNNDGNFLFYAMIAQLITFCIYGWMFRKMHAFNLKDCQESFISTILMLIFSIVFYKFLKTVPMGRFKYLIITVMIIMTIVMALAANVYKDKIRKNMAYKFFIPGVLIVIISMWIVVAHKFLLVNDAEFLPPVILLTYGFGQMLIIRGFTKYLKA